VPRVILRRTARLAACPAPRSARPQPALGNMLRLAAHFDREAAGLAPPAIVKPPASRRPLR
jgi:hypothetical protein